MSDELTELFSQKLVDLPETHVLPAYAWRCPACGNCHLASGIAMLTHCDRCQRMVSVKQPSFHTDRQLAIDMMDCLRELHDLQNGAPLERDKCRWRDCMDKAIRLLKVAEARYGR